jgi:hypothetical protein
MHRDNEPAGFFQLAGNFYYISKTEVPSNWIAKDKLKSNYPATHPLVPSLSREGKPEGRGALSEEPEEIQ